MDQRTGRPLHPGLMDAAARIRKRRLTNSYRFHKPSTDSAPTDW